MGRRKCQPRVRGWVVKPTVLWPTLTALKSTNGSQTTLWLDGPTADLESAILSLWNWQAISGSDLESASVDWLGPCTVKVQCDTGRLIRYLYNQLIHRLCLRTGREVNEGHLKCALHFARQAQNAYSAIPTCRVKFQIGQGLPTYSEPKLGN